MPETNIVVQFVSDLIDRAKGFMQQNRASLTVKQQENKTQDKADEAAKGSQKEGRMRRRYRPILRPTAIGGGLPVAMGFILHGSASVVDPDIDIPQIREAFTIVSGNGDESIASYLEYNSDPIYELVTFNSNPQLDAYFRSSSNYYTSTSRYLYENIPVAGGPITGWYYTTTEKSPEGATSSTGMESIGLPVGKRSYIHVVAIRNYVTDDTAQDKTVTTYTYNVIGEISPGQYEIGPLAVGTFDPVGVPVTTSTAFPSGKILDAKAFLVTYNSVKEVPVPAALLQILEDSFTADYPADFADYPGFTASYLGMGPNWTEVYPWTGSGDAIGSQNIYYAPGIYPVLQRDPAEWLALMNDPTPEDPYGLEDAEAFLSDNGAYPRAFLQPCVNQGTCEPGVIGHDRANVVTATTWTKNPEGTTRTTWRPGAGWKALHVWDGGNAGYCYGKLLELGFTAEDLTP